MTTTHCDLCGKDITEEKPTVFISDGHRLNGSELCAACGAPLLAFMREHHLLKNS